MKAKNFKKQNGIRSYPRGGIAMFEVKRGKRLDTVVSKISVLLQAFVTDEFTYVLSSMENSLGCRLSKKNYEPTAV